MAPSAVKARHRGAATAAAEERLTSRYRQRRSTISGRLRDETDLGGVALEQSAGAHVRVRVVLVMDPAPSPAAPRPTRAPTEHRPA
jgi:hypothetical protein